MICHHCGNKVYTSWLVHGGPTLRTQPYHVGCFLERTQSWEGAVTEEAERVLKELWEETK